MQSKNPDEVLQPIGGILAAIVPGLGYLYYRERGRALAVFLSITGLFTGGLYIGGIQVVDRVDDEWWFVLQALNGPMAFGVDYLHQNHFKTVVERGPDGRDHRRLPLPESAARRPANEPPERTLTKSLSRVHEAGTLYTAMAGMLNLIAVVDCLWHVPPGRRRSETSGRRASDQVSR
ncbi:MAG TPA: DUF6677 family protein [Phycisphaerales bacterium]|nr:DUF6677 family protein [Phycisphaerales bacterium]